ncbi:MAG: hypothetical protein IJA34_16400 [Lachnospiraceae bacterium]|nr:hypothetical protein [Lachnospiraceae bacterium]
MDNKEVSHKRIAVKGSGERHGFFSKSKVISMMASLLLSIFITVIAILFSIKLGFASNNSVINSMENVGYYDMVYEEFMSKTESLIIPNGLGVEVLDGVFSKEQIRSDGNSYLTAELNSNVFNVNVDKYKEKLAGNIYTYVAQNNLKVDGDADKIIDDICNEIMDYYIETIRVPYAATIGTVFRAISKLFPVLTIVMFVFALITGWIIFIQNPYKKNRILRYFSYSVMSAAFSTLVIPIYCAITKFYERIQVRPEYVYRFIVRYIEDGVNILLCTGIVLCVIAVGMIFGSSYIKSRYKKGSRRSRRN